MKLSQTDLARYVIEELKGGKSQEAISHKLAQYLVAERRVRELDSIMRKVAKLREQEDGIMEVNVTTAHALPAHHQTRIRELFESKRTVINETVDTSVIGGINIETRESGIDLTVRDQLKQLRRLTRA